LFFLSFLKFFRIFSRKLSHTNDRYRIQFWSSITLIGAREAKRAFQDFIFLLICYISDSRYKKMRSKHAFCDWKEQKRFNYFFCSGQKFYKKFQLNDLLIKVHHFFVWYLEKIFLLLYKNFEYN